MGVRTLNTNPAPSQCEHFTPRDLDTMLDARIGATQVGSGIYKGHIVQVVSSSKNKFERFDRPKRKRFCRPTTCSADVEFTPEPVKRRNRSAGGGGGVMNLAVRRISYPEGFRSVVVIAKTMER